MNKMTRAWHEKVVFGLHFDLHIKPDEIGTGADLRVEDLVELLSDVRPDFVQCDTKGHEGIASWPTTVGTPGRDLVNDSLAIYREATRRVGIPLIAHHSGVWDEQAIRDNPEWAAIGPDGKRDTTATSTLSEYDSALLIPQISEILESYGLDGVWVDGENWGAVADWSPIAQEEFRRRTGFDGAIPLGPNDPGWRKWLSFHRDLFREHVARYADAIHSAHPDATVVSNWMHTLRQPDTPSHVVDYVSGDFTPSFGSEEALPEAAFLDGRGMSWDLMVWAFTSTTFGEGWTLKETQHLKQEAAIILSRGGAVALYDQPTRSGRHLPWHSSIIRDVARFCDERRAASGGDNVADTLILLDPDYHYGGIDTLFAYSPATDAVRGAAFALFETHQTFDIAATSDEVDFASYKAVIVAEQGPVDAIRDRLIDFAGEGGHLVLTGSDTVQGFGHVAGFRELEVDLAPWIYAAASTGTTPIAGPWRRCEPTTARVLSTAATKDYQPDDLSAEPSVGPAILRSRFGEGTITSLGMSVFAPYFSARYPRTRHLISTLLSGTQDRTVDVDTSANVGVTVRREGNRWLIHLLDLSSGNPLSPRSVIVDRVPSVDPVSVAIRLPQSVRRVSALSGDSLSFKSDGDVTRFVVPRFEIHTVAIVETELADKT